ncbi:hypothetical protein Thi970DRAFT_00713 [Thiorhodovibrio frisius]|uniref:Uncharacterized protein n=1 Tax=Thiorhodovibrio frisius TaxID=631362 RepID=H8YX86_9GAMM|nr:hypothetical protein Thi970DRAFT_00713 [Thiorhodovibrio frisius]WPL22673.1 hypothetical protein Thiofri_02843 [Thiorhodovibrio frisius]
MPILVDVTAGAEMPDVDRNLMDQFSGVAGPMSVRFG